jgi:hypothetical protein
MNWTKEEVQLIIQDYFAMLQMELQNRPFNKADHRRALIPLLHNRNNSSVEFKHQNISAVLINMGLPFIKGYKPRFQYQKLLEEEVLKYVSLEKKELEKDFEIFSDKANILLPDFSLLDFGKIVTNEPALSNIVEEEIQYKPIKINYIEREQNNRTLGEKGEELIMHYEKWRLIHFGKIGLSDKIEWVSKEKGDGLGFDILSKNTNGTDRYIEVKSTKLTKETPIFITSTELAFAKKNSSNFYMYRVFNIAKSPSIFIRNGEYNNYCSIKPQSYKGFFIN